MSETISNVVKQLIIKEPFYGIFASGLQKSFSSQVKRMGIVPDGLNYKLLINKEYWESLNKEQKIGLLKHNLLHMCFFHVTDADSYRGFAKNQAILETSFDLEVNSYLYEEQWPDDSSTRIFKMLPNLLKKQGTKYYIGVLNDILEGNEDAVHLWGNDTQGIIEELQHPDRDHDTWGHAQGQNITLVRNQLTYRIQTAAEAVKRNVPQELQNIIDGIFTFKKPIFNWKKFFRNFIANAQDFLPKSTRRKESNRFTGAMGHKLSKKHTILVGVDTSGSIGQKELDEFFSEIYHVWKAGAHVDIVEFDTKIQAQYRYKGKTPTSVCGRGGTSFVPFVNYFNANWHKYSLCICFTDGYASLHDIHPFGKFCWVITSDGDQDQNYPGYKICIPKIIE